MKKLIFLAAIVVFVLFTFNSCDLPDEVKEQYGIDQNGQNQNKTGHEGTGDNEESPDEETGE